MGHGGGGGGGGGGIKKWGKLYDMVQWIELVRGINLSAYSKYLKSIVATR